LEVLGFGASDPNYVLASDDEEIVVVDPSTYPGASSATLRPAYPADSVNSIRSITTVSVPAAAPVVSIAVAPVASATALASADLLAPAATATHAAARPAATVPSSAIPAAANNAAPVAAATDTASAATATPDAANSTPIGILTASTTLLYSPNYVLPSNAPKNAILPPPSLVTSIYGYHVPGLNEAGPFYMASRGRNIGIFSGW
jgi:hypothetical protein